MDGHLRFQLLGGLAAWRTDVRRGVATEVELQLGGPKPRRLLAALLLSPDQPLTADRLVELVWGIDAPASARGSLQACISNLRSELDPGRRPGQQSTVLVLRPAGYQLVIDRTQLDVSAVEDAVRAATELLDGDDRRSGIAALEHAMGEWGPLLPELVDVPFVQAAAAASDARRVAAFERLQSARIDAGDFHDAIADLRCAVAESPRAERLWVLLARAQHEAGHPAEALATIHDARTALREATGLEVGQHLRQFESDLHAAATTPAARVSVARSAASRRSASELAGRHRSPCRPRPTRLHDRPAMARRHHR